MTVSVIIPTYNRSRLLTERSLPSVLAQTYTDLEVLVVGDGTDQATVNAMAAVTDPRVSFTNLPHFDYPADPHQHWALLGMAARNWGLDHANGKYVTLLDDDDAMVPDAIELLLPRVQSHAVDFVYGLSETYKGDPPRRNGEGYGTWPPGPGAFCMGAFVYRANMRYRFNYDCRSRFDHARDADLWERMVYDHVRFQMLPVHVHDYYQANGK